MPVVSVIIPTYNHRDFVLDTVDSVLCQTYGDYELLVVNDGSPDETSALLRPLAEEKKITYFDRANGGQASARNYGLAAAKGEYIAFLDDDDLWPPDKLEWQVHLMSVSPHVAAIGGRVAYDLSKAKQMTAPSSEQTTVTFESLFTGNAFVSPGQVLIRRSALSQVGGFDETIWGADDLDLFMRLSQITNIVKSDRISLYYRKHAENASKNMARMLVNTKKVLEKHLASLPAEKQRALSRRSRQWLFSYAGIQLLKQAKLDARRGKFIAAAQKLALVGRMFHVALLRHSYIQMWYNELLPIRLRTT